MQDRSTPLGPGPVHRNAAIIIAMNLARDWAQTLPLTRLWVGGSFSSACVRGLLVDVMAVQLGRGRPKSEQRAARVGRALLTWCWP
jgi:hypothetical protein